MASEPQSVDDEASEHERLNAKNIAAMPLSNNSSAQGGKQVFVNTGADSAVIRSLNNLKIHAPEAGLGAPSARMHETTRHNNMTNGRGIRKTILEKDGTQVVSDFQLIAALPE